MTGEQKRALQLLVHAGVIKGVFETMTLRYFDDWCKESDSMARGQIYAKKQVLEDVRRQFNRVITEASE